MQNQLTPVQYPQRLLGRIIILAATLILVLSLSTGCGTTASRTLSDPNITPTYREVDEVSMLIYIDDHTRTRKNADAIFNVWAERAHLKGNITGKRLLAVMPKGESVHLTYDFRLTDGTQQRVVLIVKEYTKAYRKKHKQINSAYVNGRKYDFKH